jgi:hypothetical protein
MIWMRFHDGFWLWLGTRKLAVTLRYFGKRVVLELGPPHLMVNVEDDTGEPRQTQPRSSRPYRACR